jgi:ribosomal protein S18 acetylase RimI-like enzyme
VVRDLEELGRLADENLLGTWVGQGRHAGTVDGFGGCSFVVTGIPAAFFNGVFSAGPVDDPDAAIGAAITFMAEHAVPWLLWVRDGVDDELLAAGRRAGLADAGGPPAMALPIIDDIPAPPSELLIEMVDDAEGLAVFRDLSARGFEMPVEFVEMLIADSMIDDPAFAVVVGSVDGVPASCAMVSVTGTTAGIYNVATPAEFRRRGYGEAATWAAIEAGAQRGCDHAVLQASEMGAPVYRRMGFVDVGRYVQLEGAAPAS